MHHLLNLRDTSFKVFDRFSKLKELLKCIFTQAIALTMQWNEYVYIRNNSSDTYSFLEVYRKLKIYEWTLLQKFYP